MKGMFFFLTLFLYLSITFFAGGLASNIKFISSGVLNTCRTAYVPGDRVTIKYFNDNNDKQIPSMRDTLLSVEMRVKSVLDQMTLDEIVKLYVQDVKASVEREVISLKGFKAGNPEQG